MLPIFRHTPCWWIGRESVRNCQFLFFPQDFRVSDFSTMIDVSDFFIPLMHRNWPISLTSNFDIANFWVKFSWKSNSFKMVQNHVKSGFLTLLRAGKSKVSLSSLSRSLSPTIFVNPFSKLKMADFWCFCRFSKFRLRDWLFWSLFAFSAVQQSIQFTFHPKQVFSWALDPFYRWENLPFWRNFSTFSTQFGTLMGNWDFKHML